MADVVVPWLVAEEHVSEKVHAVILHQPECPLWYTEAEMAAEGTRKPTIRPATAEELALVGRVDRRGRLWRPCIHCTNRLRKDPILTEIFAEAKDRSWV